ncbi:MAG: hypothetical protein C7B43_14945 [Sulfobacillus benefaciens]|uniref:Uncharacterized protein n=1 Tax=Sulfobacillus benefaciens TaxID=453960 RepID=A0A2T2WV55_9FIRM|nr:MAG: hypothetical protein C7B43_14945 [Sulfobacillus benefaciens]HBQ95735.1 hypothetical protein [Sulfobacillus sp.]
MSVWIVEPRRPLPKNVDQSIDEANVLPSSGRAASATITSRPSCRREQRSSHEVLRRISDLLRSPGGREIARINAEERDTATIEHPPGVSGMDIVPRKRDEALAVNSQR